jgi:hypothetical protein
VQLEDAKLESAELRGRLRQLQAAGPFHQLFESYEAEVARLAARNAALQRDCGELMAAAADRELEHVQPEAVRGGAQQQQQRGAGLQSTEERLAARVGAGAAHPAMPDSSNTSWG